MEEKKEKIREKKITFFNDKKEKLSGILTLAEKTGEKNEKNRKKTETAVLICHGFRADKNTGFYPALAECLAKKGISALRFDFTASGESEGTFENLTVTQEIADVIEAKKALEKYTKTKKIIVIGHSLGGFACAIAALQSNFSSLILIAPPSDYRKKRASYPDLAAWKKEGSAMIRTVFSKKLLKLNYHFYEDAQSYHLHSVIKNKKIPLLLIQGEKDILVTPEESKAFFKVIPAPKKMVKINDADHNFATEESKKELCKAILNFIKKKTMIITMTLTLKKKGFSINL